MTLTVFVMWVLLMLFVVCLFDDDDDFDRDDTSLSSHP